MTDETRREPGYRGALPTREDRLARPWIITVAAIFLLVIVLSIAGIPSRFVPEETIAPLPSAAASPSGEASEEPSPSESESEEASPTEEASPSPTPEP